MGSVRNLEQKGLKLNPSRRTQKGIEWNPEKIKCPECNSERIKFDGSNRLCLNCGFEWYKN